MRAEYGSFSAQIPKMKPDLLIAPYARPKLLQQLRTQRVANFVRNLPRKYTRISESGKPKSFGARRLRGAVAPELHVLTIWSRWISERPAVGANGPSMRGAPRMH